MKSEFPEMREGREYSLIKGSGFKGFFRKSISIFSIMLAIVGISVLNLLYFSHNLDFSRLFNSDSLFLPSLYREFSLGSFSFKTFFFSGAIFIFPDWIIYLVSRLLGGSTYYAIPLYFTIQISLLFALNYFILEAFLHRKEKALLFSSFVCVFLVALDASIHVDDWPFGISLLSVSHFGEFLSWVASSYVVICLLADHLSLKHLSVKRSSFHLILILLVALTTISDRLFIANWTIPALLSLYVLRRGRLLGHWTFLALSSEIIVASMAGYWWLPNALGIHSGFYENGVHIGNVYHNIKILHQIFLVFFRIHLNTSIFLLILYVGSLIGLRNSFKKQTYLSADKLIDTGLRRFLFVFLLLVFFFTCLAMVSSADFILSNYGEVRYMIPVFLSPIVLAPVLLREYRVPFGEQVSEVFFLSAAVVILVWVVSKKVSPNVAFSRSYYPESVMCVDREASASGIHRGIALYWLARYITILSKKVTVVQVNPDTSPYLWESDSRWYRGTFDFAIVSKGDDRTMRLFKRQLGVPKSIIDCSKLVILNYGLGNVSLK